MLRFDRMQYNSIEAKQYMLQEVMQKFESAKFEFRISTSVEWHERRHRNESTEMSVELWSHRINFT